MWIQSFFSPFPLKFKFCWTCYEILLLDRETHLYCILQDQRDHTAHEHSAVQTNAQRVAVVYGFSRVQNKDEEELVLCVCVCQIERERATHTADCIYIFFCITAQQLHVDVTDSCLQHVCSLWVSDSLHLHIWMTHYKCMQCSFNNP